MSSHVVQILRQWQNQKDLVWVLATLVSVKGSSYRKPGAMMLINSLGQYYGMLSGGCLEADIMHKSRQTMDDGKPRILTYDMSEDSEMAWRFGLGCGGTIDVLLQSISHADDELGLTDALARLESGETVYYLQKLEGDASCSCVLSNREIKQNSFLFQRFKKSVFQYYLLDNDIPCIPLADESAWFINKLEPKFRLVIFGGGIDAQPLVKIAAQLNWHITLCDPRETYARKNNFPQADEIVKTPYDEMGEQSIWLTKASAIVIMNHNVTLDAKSLTVAQRSEASYVGMLGPLHRTERVLSATGMSLSCLKTHLANPIGLDLGGDSPEAIALSIVSEIHACLYRASARSLNSIEPRTLKNSVEKVCENIADKAGGSVGEKKARV